MSNYVPAVGGDAPGNTYQGPQQGPGLGGQMSFNPYTAVGIQDYFRLIYDYSTARAAQKPAPADIKTLRPAENAQIYGAIAGSQGSNIELLSSLYRMDNASLGNLQTLLTASGYGKVASTGFVDEDTLQAYQAVLQDTAAYQSNNPDLQMTPEQLLMLRASFAKKHGLFGAGGGGGGGGGVPSTQTQSNVSYMDPTAARKMAHDTFSSALGRRSTAKETAAFTAALHAYERSHPSISTTTGIGTAHTATTTRQGADEAAFADAYTRSTQALANEVGSMNEVSFVNVLQRLMGG